NPEQVTDIDADVPRHLRVVAEVVGHVLPDAVEVDAYQLAAAVEDGAARAAAGGVGVGEEAYRHVLEPRVRPAARRGLARRRQQLAGGVERLFTGVFRHHA